MSEEEIEDDLKDTFYDCFEELSNIIDKEIDLSDKTINWLQDILEKDVNMCIRYIKKGILAKRWEKIDE